MSRELRACYARHIEQIERLMLAELEYWPWETLPQLREMAASYLSRPGKRLRPLLMLIFVDLGGGEFEKAYAAAAALEVYHTATLIYDDIQDNSEFRRGVPCAHVTASTSIAMNLAGTIRSFMYHILHRAKELLPEERLEIHRLIDEAATLVSLGQSIDIGWHEQWYPRYQDYPYEQMIRWKSAALFGCAAAIGAYLSGGDPKHVSLANIIGTELGSLFQKVDDYLDIFGNPAQAGRPLYNDLREGKLSLPILYLLDQLSIHGQKTLGEKVLTHLAKRESGQNDWQWLVNLMVTYDIAELLQQDFHQIEKKLALWLRSYGVQGGAAYEKLTLFLDSISKNVPKITQKEGVADGFFQE